MRVLYVFFVYSTRRFTVLVCLVILFFFGSATNTTSLFGQKLWLFTRGFLENYQFRHYFITDMRFYLFSYFMGPLHFDFFSFSEATLIAFKARSANDHSHSEEPTVRIRDSQEKKQQSTVEINKLLRPSVVFFPDQALTSNIEHLLNRTECRRKT